MNNLIITLEFGLKSKRLKREQETQFEGCGLNDHRHVKHLVEE